MKLPIKIFADFNNADKKGRVRLNTIGALRNIKEKNIQFKSGMQIILDDEEEFVISGIVEFSEEENIWVAKIDWNKLK